jgi:hypothetical protein
MICGDFRTAEAEYAMEGLNTQPDKRLQEWAYYTPTLHIYKGLPKKGAELARGMIMSNGSTPGFGWYNIAQARCRLYDGQTDEAYRYMNKAAEFKELHVGTTLGQTHYDFSIQLLKLMHKLQQIEAQKFENRNWWYNPRSLGNIAQYTTEKYMQQFLIINQFSQNPERDRVVYKLFSTESTVSWDEIWYLIRDFSTGFFLDRFEQEMKEDRRKYIRKYFRYFVARLRMEKGQYEQANTELNTVLMDPDLDAEYEKLLIARVLQAQAECAEKLKNDRAYNDRMAKLFQYYPQLIPYSGLTMSMRLSVTGAAPPGFLDRLKNCNINWVTGNSIPSALAVLSFSGTGDKARVSYHVLDARGQIAVASQSLSLKHPDAAVTLVYRLFNVGGKPAVAETDAERTTL